MSYKIDAPKCPFDWYTPWIVCRVWNDDSQNYVERPVIYDPEACNGNYPWKVRQKNLGVIRWYKHAEPVEVWQPREGETVARQSSISDDIIITKWPQKHDGPVARLEHPDGKVISLLGGWDEVCKRTDIWEG